MSLGVGRIRCPAARVMPGKTGIRPMFVCLPGDKSPTDHISDVGRDSALRARGSSGPVITRGNWLWTCPVVHEYHRLRRVPNPEPRAPAITTMHYHPTQ